MKSRAAVAFAAGQPLPIADDYSMPHRRYVMVLCLCLVLFVFRVLAQLVQLHFALDFLPPFQAWYSGALAYPWLLAAQCLIIVLMVWTLAGFVRDRWVPNRRWGWVWSVLGLAYFFLMLVRLVLSLTVAPLGSWWHAPIPAFFHLVLASFVLTVGHFHITASVR